MNKRGSGRESQLVLQVGACASVCMTRTSSHARKDLRAYSRCCTCMIANVANAITETITKLIQCDFSQRKHFHCVYAIKVCIHVNIVVDICSIYSLK